MALRPAVPDERLQLFRVPADREVRLSTAAFFDLGVFLTVLGAVMLMLSASPTRRCAGETVNEDARLRHPPKAGTLKEAGWTSASATGVLTAGGVYLILRLRTFPVILGLALLSYAVNLFIFASGRLVVERAADPSADGRRPTPTRCRRRSS